MSAPEPDLHSQLNCDSSIIRPVAVAMDTEYLRQPLKFCRSLEYRPGIELSHMHALNLLPRRPRFPQINGGVTLLAGGGKFGCRRC